MVVDFKKAVSLSRFRQLALEKAPHFSNNGLSKIAFCRLERGGNFLRLLEGQNRAFFHKLLALPKLKITTKKKSNFHRHFKTCVQIACKFSVFP
jgi:hypothetical protein